VDASDALSGSATSGTDCPKYPRPWPWVAVGDVDGDGDLDLATANGDGDTVSVLLNQLSP